VIDKMSERTSENSMHDVLSRSHDLLLALSRAAQSIQRARTAGEVYRAVGDQIKSLGGDVSLFMINDDRQSLTVLHTSYAPNVIRQVEKILQTSVIGCRFPLSPRKKHTLNIISGKTIYVQKAKKYVAAMLPKDTYLLVDQFMSILKIEQGIFAPLRVDEETLGLMIVCGLSLNEDDVPAMDSFAGQIAVSLHNVRLAQQMQDELFERRRAEVALRKSEERYHTLFDSMLDGIYRSTHDGKFVDVNPAMVRMFGYSSREEMLAVDIKNDLYFAPEERGSHILDTGQEEIDIYRMRRKDGSEIWVEDHGYYVHDEQGEILYHEGMLRDITERKQAEENSLLQSVALEAAANAISITDKNGTIQWVNPAWTALTGYSKEESIGRNPSIIKSDKHDADFYKTMWDTILAGKVWRGEVVNKRKDGSLYYEEETITPVLDGQGQVKNFIAIKFDITKHKQTEADLQRLAHTDVLTRVNNRRYLFELAEHEFEVAKRYQQPLSIVMFDLDHFKQINDIYGHSIGDKMLERVAQVTHAQLRDVDIIGRYGGEEFVVVLPMTKAQKASLLAQRILETVSAIRLHTENGPAAVTLSIGISETIHAPQDESVEAVIRRADAAMYAAKQAGRNRAVIFDAK
jgi:diguanylate cyclase (GGDEF)-like protein/PAS domain S-box-containing protein